MMRDRLTVLIAVAAAALMVQSSAPIKAFAADAAAPPSSGQTAQPAAPEAGGTPQRNGPGRQALAACRSDMQALCGAVEAGGGHKIKCLADNQDRLSPGCKAAVQGIFAKTGQAAPAALGPAQAAAPASKTAHAGGFGQVCKGDISSVCAGVEKGEGRILKCLNENAAKLSEPCQSFLSARKAEKQVMRQEVKAQCATDAQTVCGSGVKGHELVSCLRQAAAKLSPGCQQALAKLN